MEVERSPEELQKFMDLRTDETKQEILKEIFDMFEKSSRGVVVRAEVLVAFKSNKSILLEKFPKHVTEIPKCLEDLECGHKEGEMTWDQFSVPLMTVLSEPGGR